MTAAEFLSSRCAIYGWEESTWRAWFLDVLITLYQEASGFDGKRPNCDLGWERQLQGALDAAKLSFPEVVKELCGVREVVISSVHGRRQRLTVEEKELGKEFLQWLGGAEEVDVDGVTSAAGHRYIGKAVRNKADGTWHCLVEINGALCRVEVQITQSKV